MPRSVGRLLQLLLSVVNALTPKSRRLVLLYSLPDLDDAVRSLLEELRGQDLRCVVLIQGKAPAVAEVATRLGAAAVLPRSSLKAHWLFCRARHVLLTHGLYDLHVPRRQVVVNLWHGELTKAVGRWTGDPVTRSTFAVSTSKIGAAFRSAEFGVHPQRVLITGSPRNDVMLRADRGTVCDRLGAGSDRPIVVWLPTYRERDEGRAPGELDSDTQAVLEWARATDVLVICKPHPLSPKVRGPEDGSALVIDEDWLQAHDLTLYEILGASDGLITDASSVWVDYLLRDLPVWIHFPDIDAWTAAAGLCLEPYAQWVPGPVTKLAEDLVRELDATFTGGQDRLAEHRRFLRSALHRHHDDQSARRLLLHLGLIPHEAS